MGILEDNAIQITKRSPIQNFLRERDNYAFVAGGHRGLYGTAGAFYRFRADIGRNHIQL